ncbi:uncharacterized protein LOC113497428 isoform X1 [Trichoplusia ni]|uniref:Uncharacterized protein LOC113497428 isoform X1 n=1 Tax=Trichoplusia ni TaxID=7111 RepID=A0A7E5VWS3_TRINI|nr:uncharacterized protein LOC113497428 isoform X1 [Trichoplusia ni]
MFEPNTPEAEDPSTVRTMSPLTKNVTEKLMQSRENEKKVEKQEESHPAQPIHKINIDENNTNKTPMADTQDSANSKQHKTRISQTTPEPFLHQQLHFSVSKQGCLQAIHRRHIYRLKYFDWRYRLRVWQCINNSGNLKCPGTLTTNEDQEVTSWSYKHNHSYHDNKIEHKLNNGKIFSDFCEADICSQITQRELFQSSIENNTYY